MKAKLGFRNYWYPALFADEIGDEPRGVRLLGENVLLRRIDGEVHAVPGKRATTTDEVDAFRLEFHSRWKTLALAGFNDLDIWAREGLQEFYQHDDAWTKEHLFKPTPARSSGGSSPAG